MASNVEKLAGAQIPLSPAATLPLPTVIATEREELVVRRTIDPHELRRLFEYLVQEDCVHSWRNFRPDCTVEELLAWENQRRPTELFFFYVKRGSQVRLLAASTVAERLNQAFPNPGYCVLGRCYIMPEFRGQGYYRSILHYRLEYCKARFGDTLNCIHIGSVSDRITRAITNHGLPGWPRFIHLGEEELRVADEIRRVGDYLLLLPEYVERLRDALSGPHAPPGVRELGNALGRLEAGDLRNLGAQVRDGYQEGLSAGWFNDHDAGDLEQLLLFCRSIPLVGF